MNVATKDVVAKPETKPETKPAAPETNLGKWRAMESRFQSSADYKSPEVSYEPEYGTPWEALLVPAYWANLRQLRSRVRIWVEEESGAYVGMLYVLKTGPGFAEVAELLYHELDQRRTDTKPADDYRIEWRGAVIKHRIVRVNDGVVLKQGLDTEDQAQEWLRQHRKVMAR